MFNNSFYGDDILKLAHIAKNGMESNDYKGSYKTFNIDDIYIKKILNVLSGLPEKKLSSMKIIWDCGRIIDNWNNG